MPSKIEWTDETWNPVTGCTKVSAGCKHCYAERLWVRLSADNMPYAGRKFTDVMCHPERLEAPLHWKKPRKVFVNSMSDLFHEDVPDGFILAVFAIMESAPQHVFQILTKRPERMVSFMINAGPFVRKVGIDMLGSRWKGLLSWPPPNVWLGVSIEDQPTANERIPPLLNTPAAVRWLSVEPLLKPINIALINDAFYDSGMPFEWQRTNNENRGLDWVVVGGESGHRARPMHPDWVRDIRDQCNAARVPFLFKQWGEWAPLLPDFKDRGDWFLIYHDGEVDLPDYRIPNKQDGEVAMIPVGKKKAGRLLDGILHDEYPG